MAQLDICQVLLLRVYMEQDVGFEARKLCPPETFAINHYKRKLLVCDYER